MKLVIVMRVDLGMGKGKLCVQAGHASVDAAAHANEERVHKWYNSDQFKVVLKVKDEQELLGIAANARAAGLEVWEVRDLGLTQIDPGTMTCISIGPDENERIDSVTKELPLL